MTDYPIPYITAAELDPDPMPRHSAGYVPLTPADCGLSVVVPCGFGYPPNCGIHGAPAPATAIPHPALMTENGSGVEDPPGSGTYRSSMSDGRTPYEKPTAAIDPRRMAGVIPEQSRPDPAYEPRTIKTSHPDGAASWGQVLTWAVHADHIGAADESGTLWCAAGPDCHYPRWTRFDPSAPGDPDRPVSELFCWLAEHWGCRRG